MTVGSRIHDLRQEAKLSQAQLAKKLGVTRNAISQWEADVTRPSTDRLILLAKVLGVPVARLTGPADDIRGRVTADAIRLIDRLGYEAATDDVIAAACDITRQELVSLLGTRDDLLYTIAKVLIDEKIAEVRRSPPKYGSLAARMKYLFRTLFTHDVKHMNLVRALHSYSWRWPEARERDFKRRNSDLNEIILSMFDDAVRDGQIQVANFRVSVSLILSGYTSILRRTVLDDQHDVDKLVSELEPKIMLVLLGSGYVHMPGLSEAGPGEPRLE